VRLGRQTVYAHFASREALIAALIDAAGVETVEAFDAAHLDSGPPVAALREYLHIGWQLVRRYPYLLSTALARTPPGSETTHRAGTARLEDIIRRGQRTGDFQATLPAGWLAAAVIGLAHTAADQVTNGHLNGEEAYVAYSHSALRLCGVADDAVEHPDESPTPGKRGRG
jgi:AcrR family transcriptional regulator